jgi:hypothetical protein
MTPAATRRPTRIGAHHRPDRGDRPMTAATRLPTAAAVERRHARELGGAGARR